MCKVNCIPQPKQMRAELMITGVRKKLVKSQSVSHQFGKQRLPSAVGQTYARGNGK